MFLAACGAFHRMDIGGLVVGVAVALVCWAAFRRRPSYRCPRCQEVNREGAVFCAQCGARLPGT